MSLTDQRFGASHKCQQDVPALCISRGEANHPLTPPVGRREKVPQKTGEWRQD